MYENLLLQFGLTKSEIAVYFALLRIGQTTTGPLVKEAKTSSGKIYEILESLKSKALAGESIINRVRYFTAAHPSQLLEYLRKNVGMTIYS